MKINSLILILLLLPSVLFAQRNTIASQGGTYETDSKVLVSQSIGQASVIGGFGIRNAQVIQGYQQPNWDNLILLSPIPLSITISPNPFANQVMISFDKESEMNINLFDITGRLVYDTQLSFQPPYQYLDLNGLAVGPYLVVIGTRGSKYFTKLIKE